MLYTVVRTRRVRNVTVDAAAMVGVVAVADDGDNDYTVTTLIMIKG